MKKRRNLITVLSIIGIVLIVIVINSFYNTYQLYEGYQTTEAICIGEQKSISSEGAISYNRSYSYVVSGQDYILNTFEANSKPYTIIKYNPNNPNEARTYEGINIECIIILGIGLILICSPFILNSIEKQNKEKIKKIINEKKFKLRRLSKRKIMKVLTICFWGYMAIDLIVKLKDIFSETNWNQVIMEYSVLEIIIRCAFYVFLRFSYR